MSGMKDNELKAAKNKYSSAVIKERKRNKRVRVNEPQSWRSLPLEKLRKNGKFVGEMYSK